MRIGIDARLYGTKNGGLGRYSQELLKNLEKIDTQNQYLVFLQKDGFDEYQPQNSNFKKVLASYRPYSFGEQIFFPLLLKSYQLDLAHFLHFNAPIFYGGNFMLTIHDLIISHYPSSRATTLNPLLYRLKLFFYQLVVKSAAQRAKKIIAVSQFTKDDIIKLLKIKADKIEVIYEGVDLPSKLAFNCQSVLADLGITKKFLLYVGSAYPHKNLEKLVLAFKEIIKSQPELQLVLVGKKNYFYDSLERFVSGPANSDLSERIILTDYLPDEKLACLYQQAELYVFPSLIEGFGLPPLEAQNYNLPVISSNAACLPEILGAGAVYFNPSDIKDMAEKILSVLASDDLKQNLATKGQENLKRFSWQSTDSQTQRTYQL